jgi:plasmid stabilization system protein ParE
MARNVSIAASKDDRKIIGCNSIKGYELSPEATEDLQEIWVYIANDNPAAADKLEGDIYAACELLAKNG